MPMIPGPKEQSVLPEGQLAYQNDAGATPEAFGGGLARGAQLAANDADQMAMRQFAIRNETDRVNAENELMARTQDLQNGNKDKGIVGYRTLVGQNAVDSLTDYQARLQDAAKDIRSGLNPAVQRMFDQTAFRIVRGSADSMGAYSAQQQVVGAHQSARARVQLAQQGALTYADDPTPGGWDTHLADVQEASMAGSKVLGLGPDATEEQRKEDVSKVFEDRTQQLTVRDPMEAAKFYSDNISNIAPEKRYGIERMLKTMTDGHYAHNDGLDAYRSAIGQTSAPSTPSDFKADFVKPIDDKRLASVTAFVKSATPWEPAIDSAAKMYNVPASEIKLKIGMESSGNPAATTDGGKHLGLGQFDEATASRYGVTDRSDPVQSINGIAKMLAGHGGTVGGDPAKADRAYYGGNDTAAGRNTDQYVENSRVVRQALDGGGAPAPLTAAQLEGKEGAILTAARAQANQRRPGDAQYSDQVAASAHAHWAQDVQALKSQEYADFSTVLDATVKSGATTMADLPPDVQQTISKLSPQNLNGIHAQFDRNLRQANGEFTKSDPKLVHDLTQRIYLGDGDPKRITQPGQLSEFMGKGLNYTDHQRLVKEIQDANNPEGSPFMRQTQQVKNTARDMLKSSMSVLAIQHPELAEEAAYRFGIDFDNKVKAARTANQDPQSLLTPGSKDYALDPASVASFMPNEQQVAAMKARGMPVSAVPGQRPEEAPAAYQTRVMRQPGEKPADYLARIGKS